MVASCDDLDKLDHRPIDSRNRGLLIRPTTEFNRNESFLRRAAELAAKRRVPIYFEGSLLSHAYYIMQRTGAMVIPVLNDEPKDAPKVYNKLVRDRIPLIIREAGGLARVRRLGRAEAVALLKQKLVEEAFEVWNAADKEIGEELADVLDVIDALREHGGISEEELRRTGESKRAKARRIRGNVVLGTDDNRIAARTA